MHGIWLDRRLAQRIVLSALSRNDGHNEYHGGDGIDTLDFSLVTGSIVLNLEAGVTRFGGDEITGIENVIGGGSADVLNGNSLANLIVGNAGDDRIDGEDGNDLLNGGEGNDLIRGGEGNDELAGGGGDDHLRAGDGNDLLNGGEGNDRLEGNAGRDILIGGVGDDEMNGGAGIDQFRYDSFDGGIDQIEDFTTKGSSKDQLAFVRSLFEDFDGGNAFDLVSDGYLRVQAASGNRTDVQVDVDGGGDNFVTIGILNGSISNSTLASQTILLDETIA